MVSVKVRWAWIRERREERNSRQGVGTSFSEKEQNKTKWMRWTWGGDGISFFLMKEKLMVRSMLMNDPADTARDRRGNAIGGDSANSSPITSRERAKGTGEGGSDGEGGALGGSSL